MAPGLPDPNTPSLQACDSSPSHQKHRIVPDPSTGPATPAQRKSMHHALLVNGSTPAHYLQYIANDTI